MTVVEVLVASGVAAMVATGVATLSVTGAATLDTGARHWAEVAAISAVLTHWPLPAALDPPAPGWSPGIVAVGHHPHLTTVTWTRPDGTALSLSIGNHPQ
jgi:hypothetical protein